MTTAAALLFSNDDGGPAAELEAEPKPGATDVERRPPPPPDVEAAGDEAREEAVEDLSQPTRDMLEDEGKARGRGDGEEPAGDDRTTAV